MRGVKRRRRQVRVNTRYDRCCPNVTDSSSVRSPSGIYAGSFADRCRAHAPQASAQGLGHDARRGWLADRCRGLPESAESDRDGPAGPQTSALG